ncbi:hypothetical protein [Parolsenella catena]|uniref:hypothetical protein n=1 Tax=Parolsenella catena TaxID=2003188 RepID=UPI002FDED854
MTSDKERREVAARLRACAQDVSGTRDFAMYLSNWVGIEGVTDDEGNPFTVAADRRCAERTIEKLADLIDRPTCEMKSIPGSSHRACARCGAFVRRDAATNCTEVIPVRRCPNCGAEVVSGR